MKGETSVKILTSIREKDVFVVQSGSRRINDSIMELLILISACKGGSANKITGQPSPACTLELPHLTLFSRPPLFSLQSTVKEKISPRRDHSSHACESAQCSRHQPRHHNRFACLPDARFLQMPRGQPTCRADHCKMDQT